MKFKTIIMTGLVLACCSMEQLDNYVHIPLENNYTEETNEEYCEEIYQEDYSNCVDWYDENLELTKEFCQSIIFDSTQKRCFLELKIKSRYYKINR